MPALPALPIVLNKLKLWHKVTFRLVFKLWMRSVSGEHVSVIVLVWSSDLLLNSV
jgi:hypothetical protein